jgi:hypothetical protein
MASESADQIPQEQLRTAFVISRWHVLTAWHCVHRMPADSLPWLRMRQGGEPSGPRHSVYLPLQLSNTDETFDVAVLTIDPDRLAEVGLTPDTAEELLETFVIPLAVDVANDEPVRVMGFPASSPSADSDTQPGQVVDPVLPLGEVTVLKLFGSAFAAVDPVDPHGLSGGPVLKTGPYGPVVVGVVRGVPTGRYPDTALGGGLVATRIEDLASRLPEIAQALNRSLSRIAHIPSWLTQDLAVINNYRSSGLLIDDEEYRLLRKDRLVLSLDERRRQLDLS